jgi:hypothetical protein
MTKQQLKKHSSRSEIDAFLRQAGSHPKHGQNRGRILVAIDATASREPTWDHACHIQGQMFIATESLGELEIKLCYYRGYNEFHLSGWHHNAQTLLAEMTAVHCLAGHTQMTRVLRHALNEEDLDAVVFIGDAMEEDGNELRHLAGQLGLLGLPLFIFHEGQDALARTIFQDIARLSHGAYAPFDIHSAEQLRNLLGAVAVFACGGYNALKQHVIQQSKSLDHSSRHLLEQLSPNSNPRQR